MIGHKGRTNTNHLAFEGLEETTWTGESDDIIMLFALTILKGDLHFDCKRGRVDLLRACLT